MTPLALSRRASYLLMILVTFLWSIAGSIVRHLESAQSFELTFWRSFFAAAFVALALAVQRRSVVHELTASGWPLLWSGLAWACMFSFFMIALTLTSTANTLVVLSLTPLVTAFVARIVLRHALPMRTWVAASVAAMGVCLMFVSQVEELDGRDYLGMAVAAAVPLAASVNMLTLTRLGPTLRLETSVFAGAVLSAAGTLLFAWPLQTSAHDLALLALLGVFQLGLPCVLMVLAARGLAAPELSLLSLLEVVFGVALAWVFANEVPGSATVVGGVVVLSALAANEALQLYQNRQMGIVSAPGL